MPVQRRRRGKGIRGDGRWWVNVEYTRREALAGLAGATVASGRGAASDVTDEWSLPVADHGNTGHADVPAPDGPLGVGWKRQFSPKLAAYPIAAGGAVYVGVDDGRIVALDAGDGEIRWTTTLPASPQGLYAGGDRLFVPTAADRLHALDVESGDEQ